MRSWSWACLLTMLAVCALVPAVAGAEEDINPDESVGWHGFTGLFNVISADTLDKGHVSFGVVGHNYDRELSDFDTTDIAAAFAVGISDRVEFGFSYVPQRQTDYDDLNGTWFNNFPNPTATIEDGSGDLNLGAKVALKRIEETGAGFSLFGNVKIPVASEDRGLGTGGTDVMIGGAFGVERGAMGLHGNVSYSFIGDAKLGDDDWDLGDMFRYGAGVEIGRHRLIRGVAELMGESFVSTPDVGFDQETSLDLTLGFKLGGTHKGGVTFGAAYQRNLLMDSENSKGENTRADGFVAELSYTSYTPPPPPPPPPVTTRPANSDPRATLTVTPQQVYPLHSDKVHKATATCVGSDPDGDRLSYSWSATGGKIDGSGASVTWTPPEDTEQGNYEITCRVSDGRGGSAQDRQPVELIPDPENPLWLKPIFFEFDRYDITDAGKQILDRVASHLIKHNQLKLKIEGHTCYIATEEYNLALGQQRADAIRDYLVGAAVDETRMSTVSYGESRPWQDNSREITRRLNRRGEFVFSFESMM